MGQVREGVVIRYEVVERSKGNGVSMETNVMLRVRERQAAECWLNNGSGDRQSDDSYRCSTRRPQ